MDRHGIAAVLLLTASTAAAAQDEPPPLQRFEFRESHMGSEFIVSLYCADEDVASAASRAAFDRIAELDAILSDYDVNSELSQLSDRAGGPAVPVSEDLFVVLTKAQQLAQRTDGAFDVTIAPVVKLWRRARRRFEMPDAQQLAEARALIGWKNVWLDPDARTVELTVAGTRLDLGGIAKGYAADEALKILKKLGLTQALVAGAGDIVVGDAPPDRGGWVIGIAPLETNAPPSRYLSLVNRAVSTSGDAERFVVIDGVRYSHIVDPRTGLGLTGRSSVTVVAADGATSDSTATAVSVLGPEAGLALVEATEGAEALIVAESGPGQPDRVLASDGLGRLLVAPPDSADDVRTLGGAAP